MLSIHNMKVEDVETVARMVALDHDKDPEKGYKKARQHMLDHLDIVPQHCYVIENNDKQIIAAMILHPRDEVFEIEDFHVKEINQNVDALNSLKTRLIEYLENVNRDSMLSVCPEKTHSDKLEL